MKRAPPEDPDDDAGPLFEAERRARATDPWTSHAAASKAPGLAARQAACILEVLRINKGGLTVDEIATIIGTLDRVQVGRRMIDLREGGLIIDSGITRTNSNNRHVIVWKATQ